MSRTGHAQLGKDAAKLTVSRISTLLIGMVSAMLLSRFRTLDEYGTYSQLLLVGNVVTTLLILGLPNSINYFLARADTPDERKQFLSVYYTLSTIFSLVIGALLLLGAPWIAAYFSNPALQHYVYALVLIPWTIIVGYSLDNVLIVYNRTSSIIAYRVSNSAALLAAVLLVEWLRWDFSAYMQLYVAIQLGFALAVYVIVWRAAGGLRWTVNLQTIRTILVFSVPLGLALAVGTLNMELGRLLIGRLTNTEQLAIYTNAAREMPVIFIAQSLTAVLMPRMARLFKKDQFQSAVDLWAHAVIFAYTLICFIAAVLITFAPEAITLFYSRKYLPGVAVFQVASLVLLLRCTYFGMVLNARGQTKFIFYSSIASLVINLALSYVLLLQIGLTGPAWATLVSQTLINGLQLAITARYIRVPMRRIFPWRRLAELTLVNAALAACVYGLRLYYRPHTTGQLSFELLMWLIPWSVLYWCIIRKDLSNRWRLLNQAEAN